AQGIHPAARDANIAQQELDHGHRADVLAADRMLRPAERKQARPRLVGRSGAGEQLANLQEFVLWRAADARHHLGRVPIDVFAKEIDHAARMLPRVVDLGITLVIQLVIPGRLVVAASILVVAGEQSILETEAVLYD